jgi:hypothetical protein
LWPLTEVGRTWTALNWTMLDGPGKDFPQLLGFRPSPEHIPIHIQIKCLTKISLINNFVYITY